MGFWERVDLVDPCNMCGFGLQGGLRVLQTFELFSLLFLSCGVGLKINGVGPERKQGFLPPVSVFPYKLVMYKSI